MARTYKILLGYIVIFLATAVLQVSLIIWLPVSMSVISLYALYRRSTLFRKFRWRDNRYFIRSAYDQSFTRKDLYYGIILLVCGATYFFLQSYFNLDALLDTAIISSFAIFGLSKTLSSLFLEALPITELLIKDHSIEVIRNGRLQKEFYGLSDFNIDDQSITFNTKSKRFELTDLHLSKEQKEALTNELNAFRQLTTKTSQMQKDSIKKFKSYFSFKRSKA